ncbi:RNA 2',3'-cyclic phosphodiesterase [Methylomagnum sp.]
MPAASEKTSARLFFALWPDDAVRSRLIGVVDSLRRTVGGNWVRPDNWHITLAFLGEVDAARWPELHRLGTETVGQSFTLELDRMQFWPRNGIVCLASRETPPALAGLAADLGKRLRGAGFAIESRSYKAHLTLARKGQSDRASRPLDEPVIWNPHSFCLMESRLDRDGPIYIQHESWPLPVPKAIAAGASMT